jgi:hypothetical protein
MARRKKTELGNVNETWNQNERNRESGNTPGTGTPASDDPVPDNELGRTIKKEASEYDNANKTERTLGGERATVNDDNTDSPA